MKKKSNKSPEPKLKNAQLFFKDKLEAKLDNPKEYKEYSNDFSLNLIDYDLNDTDIQKLINLIIKTDKLNSLHLRLSNTLKDKNILNKLLRKISLKKQFKELDFLIKYLEDDLLSIFIEFLSKLENNLTSLEISIKYSDNKKEGEIVKKILESMLKNNNSGITSLKFKECRFNTEENLNLLNELLNKNSNKLEELGLIQRRIFNDVFTPDISKIKILDLSYCYLSTIKYLPKEKLILSFNNIGKIGLENIIENLKKENCTLKKLDLGNNYLGNEGLSMLGESLKYNKSLVSLDVSGNNILNEGLASFANSIQSKYNTTLKKLNFKDNAIDSDGIIQFCTILKDEPSDRFLKLNFSLNHIDKYCISEYGYFIGKFTNLNSIILANLFSYEAMTNFFVYCKHLSNIKKILFLGINISEDLTEDLNELLLNNKKIEKLVIATDRTLGSSFINICPGIQNNLKITTLLLPMCHIGDDAAEMLANALFKNISIKEINLEENNIGLQGVKALSEKVFGKISLNKLNISHNSIDEEGAKYIAKSLESANNLEILTLNSNNIKDNGCLNLAKGLESNDSLVELYLDYNKITNIGVNHLSKVLVKKENFMLLSLSTNGITEINDDFYLLFNWVKSIKISDNPLKPEEILKLFMATANNRLFKNLRFKIVDICQYQSLISNDNLKFFDLSFNNKSNLSLIKNILFLKNISKLNLQKNNLCDKDIQCIVDYAKEYSPPLKELLVQSNNIGIEGSKAIAELMKDNKHLKVLNIADNPLLSEGINNICDSLINHKNILSEFLINYTKCGDYCVNKIINMIKNNKKLIVLSIMGNKFTNRGTDQILSSLRMNNSLKKLSLGSNYINSKSFINLADYLSFNKSLLILEIKSSKFGDNMLKKLSKIFLYNKTLLNIFLVDNLLTCEAIVSFGQHSSKSISVNKIKVLFNAKKNEESIIKSSNPHLVYS